MATKEQEDALKELIPDDAERAMCVDWLSRCRENKKLAYVMSELYAKGYVHFKEDTVSKENLNILIPFTPKDKQWKLPSVRYHIREFLKKEEIQARHKDSERQRYKKNTPEDDVGSYYVIVRVNKAGSTDSIAEKVTDSIQKGNYRIMLSCDPLAPITGINVPEKSTSAPRHTYTGTSRFGHRKGTGSPQLPLFRPPFFPVQPRTLAGLKKARLAAGDLVYIKVSDLPAHHLPTAEFHKELIMRIKGLVNPQNTSLPVKVRVVNKNKITTEIWK